MGAVATYTANLTLRSEAFQAGMKRAANETKAFGGTAQKVTGGLSQLSSMAGSSVPLLGQLGGAVGQVTGLVTDFMASMSKGSVAAALFATGPAIAVTGALALMGATINAVSQGYKDLSDSIDAAGKRAGELAAITSDPSVNAGLDQSGQMAQKAVEAAKKQRDAVRSEMDKMGEPGFWTNADDEVRYAAKKAEAERLDAQIGMYQKNLEDARSRRDSQAGNTADLAAMQTNMAIWQDRQEYDQAHLKSLQEAADKEYDLSMAEANRWNDFERSLQEAADREYELSLAEADRLNTFELSQQKGGGQAGKSGRADIIDRSLVSLEGMRMNAEEPIALQKQANGLLANINAGIKQMAANAGGLP